MEEENKSKYKLSRVLSLVALFVLIVFLIGNGISYAMGGTNIYSWILEKIGTSKEYEENEEHEEYEESKTDINQVVEKNGVKVTLRDIAYDTNFLIMGYMFETEDLCQKSYDLGYYQIDQNVQDKNEVIVNMLQTTAEIEFQAKISDGQNETYIGNYSDPNSGFKLETYLISLSDKTQTFARVISKDQLELYVVMDISKYRFDDTANIEIIIKQLGMNMVEAMPPIFEGEWNFTVNNLNKGITEIKNYISTEFEIGQDNLLEVETDRQKTQEIANRFVEALNAKDIKTMQEYGSSDAVATVQKYNMTNMESPKFSHYMEESNSYYYFAPYEFEYNGITDPQDISLAYFLVLEERDGKFLVTCVGATG